MSVTTGETPAPPTARPRRVRVLVVVAAVLVGMALLGALLPFNVETIDGERTCVPIVHGWANERERPSDIDMREFTTNLAEMREYDTDGAYRVEAYLEWLSGPGACVPGSRDRLRPIGRALSLLAILGAVVLTTSRRGERDAALRTE